ncbi:MAG TPA: histidine phosphatase family protein [Kofleriaceae bacterium]|jgi:probable phosphoglycerate mutase|nr:histidine phosphatase family protein [Kofleriaceae bacterium]
MTRTLVLVRHGETAWNREGRFQGHTDIPLSEAGRAQAHALRARLAVDHAHLLDHERTAVLTSDLRRAHETAEIVFGVAGRTLHVRRELREFCYGVFEGHTRSEIDERFPGAMAAWLRGDPGFAVEGGESRAAVHARTHGAVRSFLAESGHSHVVVVAHGGVLRQLLLACFTERAELGGLGFGNTAAHVIAVDDARWTYRGAL